MTPTEACEILTSDNVLCANEAAQATGSVLCGLKETGLTILPPENGEELTPFFVSITQEGGLDYLANVSNGIGLVDDPAITNPASSGTVISYLKGLAQLSASLESELQDIETILSEIKTNSDTIIAGISDINSELDSIDGRLGDIDSTLDTISIQSTQINGKLPSTLGQKTMANSLAVVVASDQSSISCKDAGPTWAANRGLANSAPYSSADASGAAVAITPAPTLGETLVIADIIASSDTTLTLTFTEETSGYVVLVLHMIAGSTVQLTTRSKLKLTGTNRKLMVQASSAGNISIQTFYYSE